MLSKNLWLKWLWYINDLLGRYLWCVGNFRSMGSSRQDGVLCRWVQNKRHGRAIKARHGGDAPKLGPTLACKKTNLSCGDVVLPVYIGCSVPWLDSPLQCYNMGHNGHGINLYGVLMIHKMNGICLMSYSVMQSAQSVLGLFLYMGMWSRAPGRAAKLRVRGMNVLRT